MKDLATLLSIAALLAATVIGMALFQHASNTKIHSPCDGKCCPCPDQSPRRPEPYRPRRPGDTGEVGKVDGVIVRDM